MNVQFQKVMNDIKGNETDTEFSYFEPRICVIGSGNPGSELATLFGAKYKTILFDVDQARVDKLMAGYSNRTAKPDKLMQEAQQRGFTFTADIEKIRHCNFYVVALPAPEELRNHPDLPPLLKVCEILGKVISGGDIVVCESAFNPGVTEEECIYLIEKMSGLTCHIDFFAGCSPGWRNATDKLRSAEEIREETFRRTPEIGKIVHEIYSAVMVSRKEIAS